MTAMSIEIRLPDIGGDEVEVTEILVNVGDYVSADQSIMTVEGDKVSMDIPSSEVGVVKAILVKVGDKVKTGTKIMEFESASATKSSVESVANKEPEVKQDMEKSVTRQSDKEIAMPDIGTDEVEITEILVNVGDHVSADQSMMIVEGDKTSMDIPSPEAGIIKAILVKVGDKVKTGSKVVVLTIAESIEQKTNSDSESTISLESTEKVRKEINPASLKKQQDKSNAIVSSAVTGIGDQHNKFVENEAYIHASPSVRRLAREFGVNLDKVTPTGPKNRIVREDIQVYVKYTVKQAESGQVQAAHGSVLPWPKIDFSQFGDVENLPLTKIQKVSGVNLHRNWITIPHVTEFDESDVTELEKFRKQKNAEIEKQKLGVKVTPLVFIMKAVASALNAYPRFNSSVSQDAQTLVIKKYINIGVAVDTPNGLVVPVLKDIDKKGVMLLSKELAEISVKVREGKLTGSDMQGGCFTISSLGGIGTTSFTPIINAPEVGILAVSRSIMKPVWNGSEFRPRLMLPLSLSFDHRVIDGADGARFLSYIVKILSDLRHLVM